MATISNEKEARGYLDSWCSKYSHRALDIDVIDGTYLLVTFEKETRIAGAELLELIPKYNSVSFQAYCSYLELALHWNV